MRRSSATLTVLGERFLWEATMRWFRCLLRRHDWHSTYDHETKVTEWECRRCGAYKRGTSTDPAAKGIISGIGGSGGG